MINDEQLQETSNFLYKLLLAIGIVVMFIVGTILGIQFMVASAEDKAKIKEALIPYVVGCCVIFGAFTIWGLIVDIGQSIFNPYYHNYILAGDINPEVATVKIYDGLNAELIFEEGEYTGKEGLEDILEKYFDKGTENNGWESYHLKEEYKKRLESGEIQIRYVDLWDSEKYKEEYKLADKEFYNFPKRAYELGVIP